METIIANNIQSFRPYHPGELLKEELECRQIKQIDFAHKFGISYTALNEILNAKRPVSTEFALLIEAALGVNAELLVKMQTDYNLQTARKNDSLAEKLNNIRKIAAML
jgi:antitoxin HigA-1